MQYCTHCGATPVTPPTCWRCGKNPQEGGGNILALLAWMFIPLSIPVYPILGSLSTAAMIATGWLATALGISSGGRAIAVAVVGYVAMFALARVERAASRSKAYRTVRNVIRLLVCAVLIIALLNAPERDLSAANALALAVIGVPLLFLAARRFDRLYGFGGIPKAASVTDRDAPSGAAATSPGVVQPAQEKDDGRRVEWRDAAFFGLIPAFIGFFIGRGGGLFLGAFFWLMTVVIIVGWRYLRRGITRIARSDVGDAAAKRKVPGVLGMTILGGVLGTVAGAGLLASSASGSVEFADIIVFTMIGVIIGVIIGLVRRAIASR